LKGGVPLPSDYSITLPICEDKKTWGISRSRGRDGATEPAAAVADTPPPTNRGVLSDFGICDRFSLDWFSYTFRTINTEDISQSLGAVAFLLADTIDYSDRAKMRGYTAGGFVCDGLGRVAFNLDRPEMGVHLSLSGQALAVLRNRFGSGWDTVQFLRDIFGFVAPCVPLGEAGGQCTRADYAFDDFQGSLCLPLMQELIEGKFQRDEPTMTTRAKSSPRAIRQLDGVGHTIYLGSPSSDTQVRVYDKAAQQGLDGEWNRVELQVRSDRADLLTRRFLEGGSQVVSEVLLSYLDFKDLGSSAKRVQDRPTASWWSKFLGATDKFFLSVGAEVRSLQDSMDWVFSQVSTTLAMMVEAGEGKQINKIINSGKSRLSRYHRQLIERHKNKPEAKDIEQDTGFSDFVERRRWEQRGVYGFCFA